MFYDKNGIPKRKPDSSIDIDQKYIRKIVDDKLNILLLAKFGIFDYSTIGFTFENNRIESLIMDVNIRFKFNNDINPEYIRDLLIEENDI